MHPDEERKSKTSLPADDIIFMLTAQRNNKTLTRNRQVQQTEGQEIIVQNPMLFLKIAINNQNKSNETVPFTNNTYKNTLKKTKTK